MSNALMRENGIRGRHKRRYKATTNSKHNLPVAPNLLDRNFTPAASNRAWTADLTYIWSARAEAVADLFDYIEPFYNRKRLHSTLGYVSPRTFLEDWISNQHEQQLAA